MKVGYHKDSRTNNEYQGDKYGIQSPVSVHKRHRDRRWMSYSAAKATTREKSLAKSRQDYFRWHDSYKPVAIPKQPQNVYKEEWESWNEWLGVENTFDGFDKKFGQKYEWRDFWEAVRHVQSLHLGSRLEYLKLHREGGIPKDIPMAPDELPLWRDKWKSIGWNGYLGKTLTTQINAIKNVDQIMCICSSVHYASNVLEIVIDTKGLLSMEETLKSRSDLAVIKTYVWEAELRERFGTICKAMGSQQDRDLWMFSNVNAFLFEVDSLLLIYKHP